MDDLAGWLSDGYATAYRTAYMILRNRDDAEEAVQDALLRAWKFRESLSDESMVRPWLYRVVVNSCCSKLRRESRHRDRRAGEGLLDAIEGDGPTPAGRAEESDTARRVLASLG